MSEDPINVDKRESDIRALVDQWLANGHNLQTALQWVIESAINDPQLAPLVIRRVAVAAAKLDPLRQRLYRLLAIAANKIDSKEVNNPAGYFGSSAKRLLAGYGVEWEQRHER